MGSVKLLPALVKRAKDAAFLTELTELTRFNSVKKNVTCRF